MKKTILKSVVILLTAMITVSCSKDSAAGETGPAGPTGATGPTGPAGTNGTNGTNGNANVIGTNSVSVPPSNWFNSGDNTSWSTFLNVPAITQEIVDRGAVSVFFQLNTSWIALPYSNPQNHYFTNYGFSLGAVEINISTEFGYILTSPGTNIYRVVVISPSNKIANPNTDWNDYNQVKEALHLQD